MEGKQTHAQSGWKAAGSTAGGARAGGGAWAWGRGLARTPPRSVRERAPLAHAACSVDPCAASRLLPARRVQCGSRNAPPARPPPGLRWLHLRPVLAVDATAPRAASGLRRGHWRQVRGRGGGDRGSGPRKGAWSEDGVWESEIRLPRSEASGAGICGSGLGLEFGVWDPGRVSTVSGRPSEGERGAALAGPCRLRGRAARARGRCLWVGICGGRRGALPRAEPARASLFAGWHRLPTWVPVAFPGPTLTPSCSQPSPLCGPAAPFHNYPQPPFLVRPTSPLFHLVCPWVFKAFGLQEKRYMDNLKLFTN